MGSEYYSVTAGIPESISSGQSFTFPTPGAPELIENEASRLVRGGERQANYGHPRGDFDTIAALWSPILGTEVTAERVALCMIALKLARLVSNPKHHDSRVDVIGYAICLDRLDEEIPDTA